jgi:hypothetical protein
MRGQDEALYGSQLLIVLNMTSYNRFVAKFIKNAVKTLNKVIRNIEVSAWQRELLLKMTLKNLGLSRTVRNVEVSVLKGGSTVLT